MLVLPHTLNFFFSKIDFIMVYTIVFSLRDPNFIAAIIIIILQFLVLTW